MKKSQRTALKILDTASTLFARNGFANTSTGSIAKSSRIAHGTIFIHFPTREKLVLETIKYKLQKLDERLEKQFQDANSLEDSFSVFLDEILKEGKFITSLFKELATFPENVRKAVFKSFSILKKQISKYSNAPDSVYNYWMGNLIYIFSFQKKIKADLSEKRRRKAFISSFINFAESNK